MPAASSAEWSSGPIRRATLWRSGLASLAERGNAMRQAIETKFLGPTNRRGSRIVAKAQAGRVTVAYNHALNSEENHAAAAKALAEKWDWTGVWCGGANEAGTGYVFVLVPEDIAKGWLGAGGYDRYHVARV